MPRSVYFSQGVKSEQNLYEDLVIESLKIFGFECYYLPRSMVTEDMILNELIESSFNDAYMIEMYLENVDGFEGDGMFLSKFGLEIRTQATFVVAKRIWEKLVGFFNSGVINHRPSEGDLIYLPLTKSLFEIKFVEHKQPFFQLTNLPIYKLQCELFEASNEKITTGIAELDSVSLDFATEYAMDVGSGNGTAFEPGEIVKQALSSGTEITARVLRVVVTSPTTSRVYLGNLANNTPTFQRILASTGPTDVLVGQTSGASWSVTKIYDIDDALVDHTFENNNQNAQNRDFEVQADTMLDFSEKNPFGDPSET